MLKSLLAVMLSFIVLPAIAQKAYWQQRVNYQIDVKLDTATNSIEAFFVMEYHNNAPDTLDFIWMHLYPNAFKTDRTAFSEQFLQHGSTDFYFSSDEERGYIHRLNFESEGRSLQVSDHPEHIDIIKLHLNEPLLPGSSVKIETPFRVKLPKLFSRLGVLGPEYAITHWYPVPAMYDQNGWHPMPYLSIGEYYAPFGSWNVRITLPENMKLASTGSLIEETKEVNSDNTPSGYKTFHYSQDSVHAFAWFASKEYRSAHDTLQLPSGRIIDLNVFYYSSSDKSWENAIDYIKSALLFRSKVLGEYPYATATVVAGFDDEGGGMEYPTITRLGSGGNGRVLDYIIEHELGHNWFYGILASNERAHPWMDEGMNSYYDNRYMVEKYGNSNLYFGASAQKKKSVLPENENQLIVESLSAIHADQPMDLPADEYSQLNYSLIVYSKVALWMEKLEALMGRERFDQAMKEYYETWKFKHPSPEDFKDIMVKYGGVEVYPVFDMLSTTGSLTPTEKKKLKPALWGNLSKTDQYQYINILPLPAYNNYDKLMAGLLIHNYGLPLTKWRFAVLPQYAFGSKKINYSGMLSFHHFLSGYFRKLTAGVTASSYSINSAIDSIGNDVFASYRKIAPFVKLELSRAAISRKETWIQLKSFHIEEKDFNYLLRHSDSTYHASAGNFNYRYVNELKVYHANHRVLYPWSAEIKFHQTKDFFRADAELNYFFNYAKGGGLNFRLFASKFNAFGSGSSFRTIRYQPKLTAVRGWEDYTYSNPFFGRNESIGFASRQIMGRDGNLKIRTDMFQGLQGKSDNWVAAVNLNTTLPEKLFPVRLPISIFLDAGTYADVWNKDYRGARFMYVAGFRLSLLKDIIEIYAPVLMSSEFRENLNTVSETTGFGKRISFSFDVYKFNLRKLLKGSL